MASKIATVIIAVNNHSKTDSKNFNCRLENLNRTLNSLPSVLFDVVLIEQLTVEYAELYVNKISRKDVFKTSFRDGEFFNKGQCYNIGATFSHNDTIILGEMDVSFPSLYFDEQLIGNIQEEKKWGFAWSNLHYLDESQTKVIKKVNPTPGGPEGGFVVFNKKFYWSIGGCNENFRGLGGIDNEIVARARHVSKTYKILCDKNAICYHYWHPHSIYKGDEQNTVHSQNRKNNKSIFKTTAKDPAFAIKKLVAYNKEKYFNKKESVYTM